MTAPWQQAAVVERYLDEVRAALPFSGDQLELMARVLAHVGAPPRRILDVGTGDGVLVEFLLDLFPGAEAVALDYSKPMLDAARARLSGRPVAVVLADLSHPGWLEAVRDSRPFDAVVSGYCIHHLPDGRKRALYEEVFGLLSPGGRFLNLEHVASADPWVESLHDELFVESLAAASTDTCEEVRDATRDARTRRSICSPRSMLSAVGSRRSDSRRSMSTSSGWSSPCSGDAAPIRRMAMPAASSPARAAGSHGLMKISDP